MALDIQDKLAILDLLNRYCHNADYNPPERMRELFMPQAVFEMQAMNLHFEGIDAIIAFFTSSREGNASARHVISNVVIDGSGDRATSSAYLQVLVDQHGQMTLVAFGRYMDELQRDADGRWRIARRRVVIG